MVMCTLVRNDDGNLNVPYLNCNVDKPYVNWYNLDNSWNDNEPGLFATLFISLSLLGGRVLFCQLSVPASKHFSNFFHLSR